MYLDLGYLARKPTSGYEKQSVSQSVSQNFCQSSTVKQHCNIDKQTIVQLTTLPHRQCFCCSLNHRCHHHRRIKTFLHTQHPSKTKEINCGQYDITFYCAGSLNSIGWKTF